MKKRRKNNKFLNIFSFCKVITAGENAIICDFQRGNLKYIPISLCDVIEDLKQSEYEIVASKYSDQRNIFNEYIRFLLANGFAFFSMHREEFQDISLEWSCPFFVRDCIIEYDFNGYDIIQFLIELDELRCQFIELRILSISEEKIDQLFTILAPIEEYVLRSLRLFLPFSKDLEDSYIRNHLHKLKKIETIVIYNSPEEKDSNGYPTIHYVKNKYKTILLGNIEDSDILIDLDYFIESQEHNPYYNRKVCIDRVGNYKNDLRQKKDFGNYNTLRIIDLLHNDEFKQLWFTSPDKTIEWQNKVLRYNSLITNDIILNPSQE